MYTPQIIGLTGTNGAGKGTVATIISEGWGFEHLSVRKLLALMLEENGLGNDRDVMTAFANEQRAKHGPGFFIEELYRRAAASGKDTIIESVRTTGEVAFLRAQDRFTLLAVDAPSRVRYERILRRGDSTDDVSFQEFLEQERRESESQDPGVQNLLAIIELADRKLDNSSTYRHLTGQINEFMRTLELVDTAWI